MTIVSRLNILLRANPKERERTRFCDVRMLIRLLWSPEEQASKRTLRGIMDDAVDSLRENDSYGSLARFVEVDRRRLRITKS